MEMAKKPQVLRSFNKRRAIVAQVSVCVRVSGFCSPTIRQPLHAREDRLKQTNKLIVYCRRNSKGIDASQLIARICVFAYLWAGEIATLKVYFLCSWSTSMLRHLLSDIKSFFHFFPLINECSCKFSFLREIVFLAVHRVMSRSVGTRIHRYIPGTCTDTTERSAGHGVTDVWSHTLCVCVCVCVCAE